MTHPFQSQKSVCTYKVAVCADKVACASVHHVMMSLMASASECGGCNGGYSYHFVKSPPGLVMCVICHLPSKNPYLSECCGHIFCRSCLYQCNTNTHAPRVCPMCKDSHFNTFSNKQIDREVRSLHVYCSNKKKGCTWQGEVNDISGHLETSNGCQYEEVNCLLNCKRVMQRRHLTDHMKNRCPCRMVNCQYCYARGEYQFIEGKHKEECHKFPLDCPNKCKMESIPREDMEAHRKECPLEMVQCEYHNVGCDTRMARVKRSRHEEECVEEHLRMTKLKLTKTEDKLLSTEYKLVSTEERVNNLEVMLSRLIHNSAGSGMVIITPDWASHLATLATNLLNAPPCPVIIKLPQFHSHAESGMRWYSYPFYTYENGHKMCLSTNICRDTGSLSVWLHLLKGPHDDNLLWPLKGKFEIKLLNQINDSKHHSVILAYDDKVDDNIRGRVTNEKVTKGWGFSQFFILENLKEASKACQFLKDDCIFFQVRSYNVH